MKPGPPPLPTQLKLIRGNRGHQKLNKNEPQPPIEAVTPDAPVFLTAYAKEEWQRVARELWCMKLLSRVDTYTLAAYCNAYATWRIALETLATIADRDPTTHGLLIKTTNGNFIQNPVVLTARQAANDMVRYAAEFGFSPAARSRISTVDAQAAASKFGTLLTG